MQSRLKGTNIALMWCPRAAAALLHSADGNTDLHAFTDMRYSLISYREAEDLGDSPYQPNFPALHCCYSGVAEHSLTCLCSQSDSADKIEAVIGQHEVHFYRCQAEQVHELKLQEMSMELCQMRILAGGTV